MGKPKKYTGKYGRLQLMPIKKTQVREIAWLARLAIEDEAMAGYAKDMADILALVEQMQAVETSAVEPLAHPLEIAAQLRPDSVNEENRREDFQQTAPQTRDGFYIVPRFVE